MNKWKILFSGMNRAAMRTIPKLKYPAGIHAPMFVSTQTDVNRVSHPGYMLLMHTYSFRVPLLGFKGFEEQ